MNRKYQIRLEKLPNELEDVKLSDTVALWVKVVLDDGAMVTLRQSTPARDLRWIYEHEDEYIETNRMRLFVAADRQAERLQITRHRIPIGRPSV